jgi:uncharacterized protein DUF2786
MRQRTRNGRRHDARDHEGRHDRAAAGRGGRRDRVAAVEATVEAAVASAHLGVVAPDPRLVDALAREPAARARPAPVADTASRDRADEPTDHGHDLVDAVLARLLVDGVADVWQRGWQPVDLHRAIERHHGRAGARLSARAVGHEVARHPDATVPLRWRHQLDAIGADAASPDATAGRAGTGGPWAVPWPAPRSGDPGPARLQAVGLAVATVAALRALPRLPKLGPVPGEQAVPVGAGGPADAGVLRKVTSLLAKAESTTFPDEAEALTAKAQQLMTRHAIDRAQLEAGRGDEPVAGGRRLGIDDPYANPRYLLLAAVADANRCRAVWTRAWGFATVFGDEGDIDAVELLFTSLLVQATRAMVLEPRPAGRSGGGTRSFRHAFLVAFAGRVGQRLAEAADTVTVEAAARSAALVPLFTARREAADRALGEAFPETRTMRVSARDAAGWQAGVRAADRADLDLRRPVRSPAPRALR